MFAFRTETTLVINDFLLQSSESSNHIRIYQLRKYMWNFCSSQLRLLNNFPEEIFQYICRQHEQKSSPGRLMPFQRQELSFIRAAALDSWVISWCRTFPKDFARTEPQAIKLKTFVTDSRLTRRDVLTTRPLPGIRASTGICTYCAC